jgi:glutaredoxin
MDVVHQLQRGVPPMAWNVVLYTRQGCCLCDQAKALLEKHGLTVQEVDIDSHPALQARYTDCVPVVCLDGRERFRGRVDERLLRRLLRSKSDV